MRAIRLATLDKTRPVVVLTPEAKLSRRTRVTVAPVTSTTRGLNTEVSVGAHNGIDHDSVVSCDNIQTIPTDRLGRLLGYLTDRDEHLLAAAIMEAFDLAVDLNIDEH